MHTVAVIGGGPAGLMAAEVLTTNGILVDLYEAKPSVGRKFLVAGKGGLNLTHNESFEKFVNRFTPRFPKIRQWLESFGPNEVREWSQKLGIETFVGPSGRVFPNDLKAFPLLQRWLNRLHDQKVQFHTNHQWKGWDSTGAILFETPDGPKTINPDATILALGGGSWSKLGSNGNWVPLLEEKEIQVSPLRPSNCGFHVEWSQHFRERNAGQPLKSVAVSFTNSEGETFHSRGSCVATDYGLESGVIYNVSSMLRDELAASGRAVIEFDLVPDLSVEQVAAKLCKPRGSRSLSNHLRKQLKIKGVAASLIYEFASEALKEPEQLARAIKALPVPITATRPLEEAISTAGGIAFENLDEHLMVRSRPSLFCAGEMLDWEAPTGGYLLTACFASGRVAAAGAMNWLDSKPKD